MVLAAAPSSPTNVGMVDRLLKAISLRCMNGHYSCFYATLTYIAWRGVVGQIALLKCMHGGWVASHHNWVATSA